MASTIFATGQLPKQIVVCDWLYCVCMDCQKFAWSASGLPCLPPNPRITTISLVFFPSFLPVGINFLVVFFVLYYVLVMFYISEPYEFYLMSVTWESKLVGPRTDQWVIDLHSLYIFLMINACLCHCGYWTKPLVALGVNYKLCRVMHFCWCWLPFHSEGLLFMTLFCYLPGLCFVNW
jgi:hypothetical protein